MNDQLRALFPITNPFPDSSNRARDALIYLNHAAVSPPPAATIAAIESQLRDVSLNGSLNYRDWVATKQQARELIAGNDWRAT